MHSRPQSGRFGSRSLALLVLAMASASAGCAGGPNGTTGTGGSAATGGSTGAGGSAATGGSMGTGGGSATGGSTGTGGKSSTGGATGTGGVTATGGTTGSGGSVATGGITGTGGVSATGGTTGTGGSGGTGGAGGCPSNATFCSGFESPGLPSGAVYMVNAGPGDWSRDFAIDTSQHHAGSSSLLVKNQNATGSSGSGYRMLAVPVPTGGAFWVSFWVESDTVMGGSNPHNAFAGPSPTATPNDPLDSFAEDVGISFHTLDSDVTWPATYGRLQNGSTNPYTLPAMTWACVEISYDLSNKHQQLYINGTLLIDATNYPPSASYSGTFGVFKFGFDSFNGPARQMWYDDVVVAPSRVGCP